MSTSSINTIIIMFWISILIVGLAIAAAIFYIDQRNNNLKQQDAHMAKLGQSCVKHIHNLSASANSNLQDVYSFNNPKDAQNYVWAATAQCMINYPTYSTSDSNSRFNLSLN